MALTLRKYSIELDVVVKGLQGANKAIKSLKGGFRSLQGSGGGLISTFAKLTAGYLSFQGATRGSRFIVETIATFESMEATLITLLGSQEAATAQFQELRKFALATPFTVEGVTRAFTQLTARGFKPTIAEMRSVGNTAAAFGLDITSFANAVGQAMVGENERLKQFGLSVKVQGKQLELTYEGITKRISRSPQEIAKALLAFGEETKNTANPFSAKFAGAAELQSQRLGGAISRLKDVFQVFAFDLGKGGLTKSLVDLLDLIRTAIGGKDEAGIDAATERAKKWGKVFGDALERVTTKIKELPEMLKKARERFKEFTDNLPDFLKIDNFSEALNRVAAALSLIAGGAAIAKIIALGHALFAAFAAIGLLTLPEILIFVAALAFWLGVIFLVVDDIITFMRDGDSVIGALKKEFDTAQTGILAALRELFDAFRMLWTELKPFLIPLLRYFVEILPGAIRVWALTFRLTFQLAAAVTENFIRRVTTLIHVLRLLFAVMKGDGKAAGEAYAEVMKQKAKLTVSEVRRGNEIFKTFGQLRLAKKKQMSITLSALGFEPGASTTPAPTLNQQSGGILAGGGGLGTSAGITNVSSTSNTTINVNSNADPEAIASEVVKKKTAAEESANRKALAQVRAQAPER